MKKMISILLSVLLILPFGASFGIPSAAQSQEEYYADLFAQREAYMRENYQENIESGWWGEYHTLWACVDDTFDHPWVVILYTDVADQIELVKKEDVMGDGNDLFDEYSEYHSSSFVIEFSDYSTIATECKGSMLRALVHHFDISKQELLDAYKKMKENPDAIRPILSFLTDAEFERGRNADGYFGTWDIPEFVIEALYIEDDIIAENLLCHPFAVYMEDYSRYGESEDVWWSVTHENIVVDANLFHLSSQVNYVSDEKFEDFLKCDLASIGMKNFIEYLKGMWGNRNRSPEMNNSRYQRLMEAYEAQLAAKETGDGAVYSVAVLALAIPALAATLILRRKKRI